MPTIDTLRSWHPSGCDWRRSRWACSRSGLGWLTTAWLRPATGPVDGGLLYVLCMAAAVGIPFGIFALLGGRQRTRPATFVVAEGSFVAPTSAIRAGNGAITWMFFGGISAVSAVERHDLADAVAGAIRNPIALGWAAVFAAIAVATLMVERPRLTLDHSGVEVRRLWTRTRMPWDRVRPATVRTFAQPEIPHRHLYVDPAFLDLALRRYAERPEARAEIGTAEGLTRLRESLSASVPG